MWFDSFFRPKVTIVLKYFSFLYLPALSGCTLTGTFIFQVTETKRSWSFSIHYHMRKILRAIGLLFTFWLLHTSVGAQPEWKIVTINDGITVSAKSVPDSKIKALRVDCNVSATLSEIVALMLDMDAATQWISHTKSCRLIRKVSPSELFYYAVVDLPWPLENRDFVAHITVTQHPVSKMVTINAPAVEGWIKKKDGIVRITRSTGFWTLTPLDKNTTQIQYTLQVDPGGAIPAWLVNSLSAQGPIESFKNMRKQLLLPKYRHVRLPFIGN
jgi:hypothetical protein